MENEYLTSVLPPGLSWIVSRKPCGAGLAGRHRAHERAPSSAPYRPAHGQPAGNVRAPGVAAEGCGVYSYMTYSGRGWRARTSRGLISRPWLRRSSVKNSLNPAWTNFGVVRLT